MSFSERIKEILIIKDRKHSWLADMLGVTPATVSHYVNGAREPNIETIKKIAIILGTSPSYLIGDDSRDGDNAKLIPILFNDNKDANNSVDYEYISIGTNDNMHRLHIASDSDMSPIIKLGDQIIVDHSYSKPISESRPNSIYLIKDKTTENISLILRNIYYKNNKNIILTTPKNIVPPTVVGSNNIELIGKVMKVIKNID